MSNLAQTTDVLDNLDGATNSAGIVRGEEVLLTPYLTLACSLLYMMASDGHLGEQESSHLQGVLGGDDNVLSYALHYVQSVPLEKFLLDAPELLSTKDKWCILTNVSDALLADGHADDAELALLSQLVSAFGVSEKAFKLSLTILKLKNDKSILGPYTGVKQDRQTMTPHFALAASLLYMLTADGAIGAEEIGQLEAVIGEFDGLQNVALKYVRSVKLKPFLDEAKVTLKREQKLYILTNVCDSMLADGSVARLEDKVFMSMVNAFGFDEKSFAPYYQVLETKNFKPFECSFKNRAVFQHASSIDQQKVEQNSMGLAANQGIWASLQAGAADMGSAISQTMQENIQSVNDDFGDRANIELVTQNATDSFNLQKTDESPDDGLNRQKLASDIDEVNRQQIDQDSLSMNRQLLSSDALPPNFQQLDTEERLQNIHEVAEEVNVRLDHFERQNFSFLQVGRTQRYDDSFAPIQEDKNVINRQRLAVTGKDRAALEFPVSIQAEADAEVMSIQASQSANLVAKSLALDSQSSNDVKGVSTASSDIFVNRIQRKPMAGVLPHLSNRHVAGLRMTRLNYVQLVTAFAALTFAAPISTKTSISRVAVGPLIVFSQDQVIDARDLN